jgi:small ligand-binding sensory domain FIST
MTFRVGHARATDWESGVASLVAQLGTSAGSSTLGFVYVSDHLAAAAKQIVDRLKRDTGVANWVGTVGIGVLATGVEYMDEGAIVAMITDWPADEYSIFSGRARLPNPGATSPSGATMAHFGVVHGDPSTADMPELIADMSSKVDSGFLVGGLSSSRKEMFQIANEVLSGGLSGVVLSSAIPVHTRLTQGCSPLPGRHVITQADGTVIAKIDGRPALDVFKEAAGEMLARDLRRAAHVVLAGLPVAGSDTGDYLVRNVIGIDPKNKLIAIGAEVETNQPLLFCKRDGDAAREDLTRMVAEVRAATGGKAKGGLYFACVARGESMFGRRSAELELIREALGDVPLVGFFANGEISHDRLYGYTGVLTVFT